MATIIELFILILIMLSGGILHRVYGANNFSPLSIKIAGYTVIIFSITYFIFGNRLFSNQEDAGEKTTSSANTSTQSSTTGWETIDRYKVKKGLAKDTETNLMWMRCALGKNWGRNWFFVSTCLGDEISLDLVTAKEIAKNNEYYGYKDWRIPTNSELQTLIYCSSNIPKKWNTSDEQCLGNYSSPTILESVFPNTALDGYFWSSTPIFYTDNTQREKVIGFQSGHKASIPITYEVDIGILSKNIEVRYNRRYIRLVRNYQD